jgi:DNA polymerase-3 subunit alpha
MDAQREMFLNGAKENNDVPASQAGFIFDQIAKFAGYGFNKSHAAAYALIAYWTGWLKANYPVEFMAASMTLDLGNTDKLAVFRQDLDKMKIKLLQPDVNVSQPVFSVEDGAVRYALGALKGVGAQAMAELVAEREKNGPYKSLEDFARRLDPKTMNRRQFEQLVSAGAFDSLHANRAQLFAACETILRYASSLQEERDSGQVSLFGDSGGGSGLGMPALPDVRMWTPLEKLEHEFSAVGFYLSAHPLDGNEAQFARMNISSCAAMQASMKVQSTGRFQMAGVLLKKQEKISQKGNKYAFLQLSDPTGIYEVTIFSETLHGARSFLEAGKSLLLTVEAEIREDQVRLTTQAIRPLDQALEQQIQEIRIEMTGASAAAKLKQFLDVEGHGRARIVLYVPLGDGRTGELKLPGTWNLSPQARNVLRTETGVLKVAEG